MQSAKQQSSFSNEQKSSFDLQHQKMSKILGGYSKTFYEFLTIILKMQMPCRDTGHNVLG